MSDVDVDPQTIIDAQAAKIFRLECELAAVGVSMREAMTRLDNPPGASHREMALRNSDAWRILQLAVRHAPEPVVCPTCSCWWIRGLDGATRCGCCSEMEALRSELAVTRRDLNTVRSGT